MKKNIGKILSALLMTATLSLFVSCKDKIMGYSVLLWNAPEYGLQSGDVVPVYIRSNISQVYVIGVVPEGMSADNKKIEYDKVEVPLWKLTDPVKKGKINGISAKYAACAHTYASVKIDGLPCRAEPVNTAKQVYRCRKGEVIKLLYKGKGTAPTTGGNVLEGDWYRILTSDGNPGWCFSYNLNIYEIDADGNQVGGEKIEEEVEEDVYMPSVLNKPWYPDSFSTMISSGNIDVSKLHPSYNFTIDTENNRVTLNLSDVHESWEYKGYTKTDDYEYKLNDIPIIIIYKKSNYIVARYTDDSGKPKEINLVIIGEDINEIVANEKVRREKAFSEIAGKSANLTSSSYGNLSISEDGSFRWTGYKLLVPAVISASAKNVGTCSVKYALSKSLAASYDGILSFRFDGTTEDVNFLYKFENGGVRFEDATGSSIDGILVTSRSSSPLVVFFKCN